MAIIPNSYSLYDSKTIELAAAEARDRAMAAAASADAASDSASQAAHYAEEAKISFSGTFEAYSGAVEAYNDTLVVYSNTQTVYNNTVSVYSNTNSLYQQTLTARNAAESFSNSAYSSMIGAQIYSQSAYSSMTAAQSYSQSAYSSMQQAKDYYSGALASANTAGTYANQASYSSQLASQSASAASASEAAAKSAKLGAEAARDAAENYSRGAFSQYSATYAVGQHVDEVYSDFSGLYSTFADPFASLSEYGILQETGNETSSGATAPEYIKDVAKAAFESRGVTMTSIGTYSDAAYSYSLEPSMTLVENQILRHQLLYSGGAYPSLSYSQLYVKTFATAELWIEIPSSGGVSDLIWPVGTWLEGSAPATLPSGYGYCVVLRNADLSSGLLMNLAYKYSI